MKGISKSYFNKDVCGDIMGLNESNVFADVLTGTFSQLYPCLSLKGREVKEKTEREKI